MSVLLESVSPLIRRALPACLGFQIQGFVLPLPLQCTCVPSQLLLLVLLMLQSENGKASAAEPVFFAPASDAVGASIEQLWHACRERPLHGAWSDNLRGLRVGRCGLDLPRNERFHSARGHITKVKYGLSLPSPTACHACCHDASLGASLAS